LSNYKETCHCEECRFYVGTTKQSTWYYEIPRQARDDASRQIVSPPKADRNDITV